jgi:hypothetical protein
VDPSHLVEIEAIRQLKARYFRLMDTKQWTEWAEVFSVDARLEWGPQPEQAMVGRSTIVQGVRSALEGATTCHHGHTPEIEILDDRSARGVWAMEDVVDHPRFFLHGWGHYHEEYAKEDGRWRIRRTRLTRIREERIPR